MQVEIARRGSKAVILTPGLPEVDKDKLSDILGYKDAGNAYLNKRMGKAKFATNFSALNKLEMSFPAGLLVRVVTTLKRQGHEVVVHQGFENPVIDVAYNFTRPYQQEAAEALLQHCNGHVCVPTGGGKTYIIDALVTMLNRRTVVIVPSIEILNQVHGRLEDSHNVHISRVGGKDVFTDSEILVGTWQTLISRIEANDVFVCRFLDSAEAAIVDECHHMPCDSIRTIVDYGRKLNFIYGLSATPYRKDGLEILMEGSVGPLRYTVTPATLVAGGYIVPGDVTMMEVPGKGKTGYNGRDDYHKIYEEHIVRSEVRRALEVIACQQALMFGLSTICFTKRVEHATDIFNKVKPNFQGVELLTGETKKKDRARILADLATGVVRLVVATVGKEGLDVPNVSAVIFAEGGTDPSQHVGRALRPSSGKTKAQIWDFYDAQHSMLEAQAKKRLAWYSEQGIYTLKRV